MASAILAGSSVAQDAPKEVPATKVTPAAETTPATKVTPAAKTIPATKLTPAAETTPASTMTPEALKKELSYFLGYQSGKQLSNIPTLTKDDLDMAELNKGLNAALDGAEMPDRAKMEPILQAFQKTIETRIEAKAKTNLEVSKKFMEENGKKEGIVTTKSGLQYKIAKKGEGKVYSEKEYKEPLFKLQYTGKLIDGREFDSSKGQSVEFPLQLIPGFTEALSLMPIGSEWTVYIPAELAYKEEAPQGTIIEPNSPLIFDIKLEDIKEAPAPPAGGGEGGMQITPEMMEAIMKQQQGK